MKMTYKKTKEILTNKLIENVKSQKEIKNKFLTHSLTPSETLFTLVLNTCQTLQMQENLSKSLIDKHALMGISRTRYGWFCVNNKLAKGKFINANAIFKNAYCESSKCHTVAYNFMIDFNLNDMELKSGTINPYDTGDGILHSICTFKKDDKEYVFDGANFLLMDKDLYYSLFKFIEIQSISKETLMKDRFKLASKQFTGKGILKTNARYRFFKNTANISKRFKGMGFIIYLYNRDAIINNDVPINELESDNINALNELNRRLKEMDGEDSYKF